MSLPSTVSTEISYGLDAKVFGSPHEIVVSGNAQTGSGLNSTSYPMDTLGYLYGGGGVKWWEREAENLTFS
jgi:hypothetical protein